MLQLLFTHVRCKPALQALSSFDPGRRNQLALTALHKAGRARADGHARQGLRPQAIKKGMPQSTSMFVWTPMFATEKLVMVGS